MTNTKKKAGLALALALSLGVVAPQTTFAADETGDVAVPPVVEPVPTGDAESLEGNDAALGFEGTEETVVDEETTGEGDGSYVDENGIIIDEVEEDEPSTDETLGADNELPDGDAEETPVNEDTTDEDATGEDTTNEENLDNSTDGEETPDDGEDVPDDGSDEDLIDEENPEDEESEDVQEINAKALEDEIAKLEEKLAAGSYTEESRQKAEDALAKAKALIASGEFSEVELATAIAEIQVSAEGLVLAPESNEDGEDGEDGDEGKVDPNAPTSDEDPRDLKPSDIEGKEPGDYEEWVDDDYVDSNKEPAKSLEELEKDPNAIEVKNEKGKEGKGTESTGSKGTVKTTTVAPSTSAGGYVKAQTGGGVSIGIAGILAAAAGSYTMKKKNK